VRVFPKARLLLLLLLIGGLLYWQHPRLLQGLGRFLVKEDRPQRADLIVCLSGSWGDRTLAAVDLYRAGWSRRVFLFREQNPEGYELLRKKGISLPESRDLSREILLRSGIPRAAILTDEREATSTYDEACILRDFIASHSLSHLILVTSKSHSRRAYLTFRSLLDSPQLKIWSLPTPYDGFDPRQWWKQEKSQERVLLEYQKILISLLRGRIRASLLLKRDG